MKYKITKLLSVCLFITMFVILCFSVNVFATTNVEGVLEKVYRVNEQEWVVRKDFGVIAKDVEMVKTGYWDSFGEVFIKRKNEDFFREVNLFEHQENDSLYYKTNIVTASAKDVFPSIERMFVLNNKNRLLFTGKDLCELMFHHKSAQECKKSSFQHKDVLVKKNITKGWSDNEMFAFISKNSLVITGGVLAKENKECYQNNTELNYFKGKGNSIKKVVCGECDGFTPGNIFVLMNNGSVWGMGSNRHKLISNSKKKYYNSFIKIVKSGVKDIAANTNNVAIIKKNNELWIWGKRIKQTKKKDTFIPYRVAKHVKEISMVDSLAVSKKSVIIFLKKNNVAYGLGQNSNYVLTNHYKKKWYSKPLRLQGGIKHIYTANGMTFLLNRQNELYWTGTQNYYPSFDWVAY